MSRTAPIRASEPTVRTIVAALVAVALACCVMQFVPPFDARVDLIKRDVAQSAIDKLHASYVGACQQSLARDAAWNGALLHLKMLTERVEWTAVVDASPAADVDAIDRERELWDHVEMRPVLRRELQCWAAVDAARFLYAPRIFDNLTVTPRPNDLYRLLFRSGGLMTAVLHVAFGAAFFAIELSIVGLCVRARFERAPHATAGASPTDPVIPETKTVAQRDEKSEAKRTSACRFDNCTGCPNCMPFEEQRSRGYCTRCLGDVIEYRVTSWNANAEMDARLRFKPSSRREHVVHTDVACMFIKTLCRREKRHNHLPAGFPVHCALETLNVDYPLAFQCMPMPSVCDLTLSCVGDALWARTRVAADPPHLWFPEATVLRLGTFVLPPRHRWADSRADWSRPIASLGQVTHVGHPILVEVALDDYTLRLGDLFRFADARLFPRLECVTSREFRCAVADLRAVPAAPSPRVVARNGVAAEPEATTAAVAARRDPDGVVTRHWVATLIREWAHPTQPCRSSLLTFAPPLKSQ